MNARDEKIKTLILDGKSPSDIATILGCSRATIYNAKARAYKNGEDWDALALAKARGLEGVQQSEKEFITSLIREWESTYEDLGEMEPEKRLLIFDKFANSYYRLKAPLKEDCTTVATNAVENAIKKISELALKEENSEVIKFLSEHSDVIVELAMKQ